MDSTPAGIASSNAFAALRLSTNSNFVGCSTGKLAGFSPLMLQHYNRQFNLSLTDEQTKDLIEYLKGI
jgi:hypothetical protein